MGKGQVLTVPNLKYELKQIFDQDYEEEEIEKALEVLVPKNRVEGDPSDQQDQIYVFPDQFFEGV